MHLFRISYAYCMLIPGACDKLITHSAVASDIQIIRHGRVAGSSRRQLITIYGINNVTLWSLNNLFTSFGFHYDNLVDLCPTKTELLQLIIQDTVAKTHLLYFIYTSRIHKLARWVKTEALFVFQRRQCREIFWESFKVANLLLFVSIYMMCVCFTTSEDHRISEFGR